MDAGERDGPAEDAVGGIARAGTGLVFRAAVVQAGAGGPGLGLDGSRSITSGGGRDGRGSGRVVGRRWRR